ncbi:hypothetical protein [Vreelandella sedimenti]|uniref:hypothetical protein n=1 Tax=Vreelandella sedimenti TaxID=2729618 RepID=UPI00257F5D02|nr:hypothetical protein [Halomonas sp. UBA3173]|tara:strand:+ start:5849 stop:6463 length:615 start_codon:yes stop_codon:yes gene_type:complete
MIDAIVYLSSVTQLPVSLTCEDGKPAIGAPQAGNSAGERLHYVRMTSEQLNEWRPHVTVLAEAPYTGTGTADHIYQQIQNDAEKLALYESVYDTSPRIVDDGEGGTMEFTPPFKFGMLAESALRVPRDITARQARLVLVKHGLFEQVDDAIASIDDDEQRQIAGIEWEYATRIEREAPWVNALYENLGLTKEGVDHLFIEASEL